MFLIQVFIDISCFLHKVLLTQVVNDQVVIDNDVIDKLFSPRSASGLAYEYYQVLCSLYISK